MAQDANQVDTATIRTQIEQTRSELGRTIDAIQDRLSLRRVVHEAKESFVHATVGRARRLAHQVTDAVNSGQASSNVSAVLDQARSNPAISASGPMTTIRRRRKRSGHCSAKPRSRGRAFFKILCCGLLPNTYRFALMPSHVTPFPTKDLR